MRIYTYMYIYTPARDDVAHPLVVVLSRHRNRNPRPQLKPLIASLHEHNIDQNIN